MIQLLRVARLIVFLGMFLFSFTSTPIASEEYGSEEQEITISEEGILEPEFTVVQEEEEEEPEEEGEEEEEEEE